MMNLKVVTSNVLQEKVNALKKVCNPTCFSGNYAYYKIKSDIPTTEAYQMRLVADGLYSSEDSSVLSLIAYIDDATTISGNLSGLESVSIGLGSYVDDNNIAKYCIIVDSYGLQSLNAELFCGDLGGDEFDAKNHIVSIEGTDTLDEGVALIEIQNVNTLRDFYFYYAAANGSLMRVDNGGTVLSIDRSGISNQTENLKNSINVSVNSAVSSSVQITGLGSINADLSGCSITLEAGQLPSPTVTIPAATTTELGGVKLFNSDSELLDGAYRVKLDLNNKAYVEVPKPDIHRYANLDNLTNLSVGTIVQYIGNTTEEYVNGYFYQYWPTSFATSINDGRWMLTTSSEDASAAIREYNKSINYTLRPNVNIVISLLPYEDSESDSDEETEIPFTNDTLFRVTQQLFNVDMTLSEINSNFGISLKPAYSTSYTVGEEDLYTVVVSWNSAGSAGEWVLKNVLPTVLMASALTYKGVVPNMAALEALTPTAQEGDFYTVTDLGNLEYFFNGTSWEFMGEVVATYIAGNNIEITISDRKISAKGYVYDNTKQSIATGYSTQATGYYSHTEGRESIASNNQAHAEGYNTEASGVSSHAEGEDTLASAARSHAEGYSTVASGIASHAECYMTEAFGGYSHAEGIGVIYPLLFTNISGTTIWLSNIPSSLRKGLIVSNSTRNGQKRIITAINSLENNITINSAFTVSVSDLYYSTGGIAYGNQSHVEGQSTATGNRSHAEGEGTIANGDGSHAEGRYTCASNSYSHAEGYYTEASGQYGAHAEGGYSKAAGHNSHAEGWTTETYGEASHSEGLHTTALGPRSHAEGMSGDGLGTSAKDIIPSLSTSTSNEDIITAWDTTKFTLAKGENAHAEGESTLALGENAHASGECTIADADNMTAVGSYNTGNINDSSNLGNCLLQVGNGNSISNKLNAFTVFDSGLSRTQINILGEIYPQDNYTHNTLSIEYRSKKYNYLRANSDCTITVFLGTDSDDLIKCASDIIVHVVNNLDHSIELHVVNDNTYPCDQIANMWDANLTNGNGLLLAAGQHAELCFTFWGRSNVSFNGGLSV